LNLKLSGWYFIALNIFFPSFSIHSLKCLKEEERLNWHQIKIEDKIYSKKNGKKIFDLKIGQKVRVNLLENANFVIKHLMLVQSESKQLKDI